MCSGLVANLHSPTLYATAQTILCQIDGVLGVRLGEGPIPREYGRRPYLDYPIHKSTEILPNLEYRTTRILGFGIGLPYRYAPLLCRAFKTNAVIAFASIIVRVVLTWLIRRHQTDTKARIQAASPHHIPFPGKFCSQTDVRSVFSFWRNHMYSSVKWNTLAYRLIFSEAGRVDLRTSVSLESCCDGSP